MVLLPVSFVLALVAPPDETSVAIPGDAATEPPRDEAPPPATNPDAALYQLAAAHALRNADDLPAAIAAATSALDNDPELAAAYLTRAQLRAELATEQPPDGVQARATWVQTLHDAADDLQAYMDRATLDTNAHAAIAEERERLRELADANAVVEPEAPPDPIAESKPDSVVRTMPGGPGDRDLPPERADPIAPLLVGIGIAATGAGAGLGSAALRVEQVCDNLCAASWSPRIGFASSAAVASTLGAVVIGLGTARWIDARAATPRTRTIAGVTLLSTAVAAGATGATLMGVARARWQRASPSQLDELSDPQRLANAGLAVLAVVPSLLSSGLVTMLVHRRNSRSLARVQP